MKHVAKFLAIGMALLAITVSFDSNSTHTVHAQSKKKKSNSNKKPAISPAELKDLQQRTQKSLDDFMLSQVNLATEFEKAGLLEQAKTLLQTVQKINKDLPGLDKKIQLIEESILRDNPADVQIDTSKGWGDAIARVEKGKPIRIRAEGRYRMSITATVDTKGFPTNDKIKEMAKDVRCGALMAIIVPVSANGKPGKPSDQIEIGAGRQFTPKDSGLLFLAVNAPPGSRCTGKINVQLSGYVRGVK